MTTQRSIDHVLAHPHLALAGASRSGRKFGNTVLRTLVDRGYLVSVVHPQAESIDGHRCCASIDALPEEVEALVLVTPPEQTTKLVEEAAARGIHNVWMQQGAESAEAIRFCADHGIDVVHGECILLHAEPRGLHRVHRWIRACLGTLPK